MILLKWTQREFLDQDIYCVSQQRIWESSILKSFRFASSVVWVKISSSKLASSLFYIKNADGAKRLGGELDLGRNVTNSF